MAGSAYSLNADNLDSFRSTINLYFRKENKPLALITSPIMRKYLGGNKYDDGI